MKILIVVLCLVSLSHNSMGQFMGYLTKLEDSKRESAFSEITLVHRSREAPERFIYEIGSINFMVPKMVNGKELIISHDHFQVVTGSPFIRDKKVYIQAFLYYDSETIDPRDDIIMIALPFEISKDLMDKELQHYHGQDYIDYGFAISKE
jgi:hypothetical protein